MVPRDPRPTGTGHTSRQERTGTKEKNGKENRRQHAHEVLKKKDRKLEQKPTGIQLQNKNKNKYHSMRRARIASR